MFFFLLELIPQSAVAAWGRRCLSLKPVFAVSVDMADLQWKHPVEKNVYLILCFFVINKIIVNEGFGPVG